eukprot:SAG25_NODE_888_length_4924_cov_17.004560_7_plen_99_part_00
MKEGFWSRLWPGDDIVILCGFFTVIVASVFTILCNSTLVVTEAPHEDVGGDGRGGGGGDGGTEGAPTQWRSRPSPPITPMQAAVLVRPPRAMRCHPCR